MKEDIKQRSQVNWYTGIAVLLGTILAWEVCKFICVAVWHYLTYE
jgi:hypothetical protein